MQQHDVVDVKKQSVENLRCSCNVPWYNCEKHCRLGEVFKRLNATRTKAKKKTKEEGRDANFMQKNLKRVLDAFDKGEGRPVKKTVEILHLRPKYKDEMRKCGVNPNFLCSSLKQRFGIKCDLFFSVIFFFAQRTFFFLRMYL